ncbi:MAG: hypothetical protein KAH56_12970 [Candidatus Krumholzibacteria bacterium]|nr:hypothetical protein [Candidatus Krumholzibacteria bacterium]
MLTRKSDGARAWFAGSVNLVFVAVLVAAVFLMAGTETEAQEGSVPDWNDSLDTLEGGIGLHYGILGGHGLAFRLPLKWWLYFQVAGGILHTSDHKQHNVGFQLNYLLRQDQRMRIFLSAGSAYFYDDEKTGTNLWVKETNWNYGAGVGLEYLMGKRWSLQAEGDFAHHGNSGDITVIGQAGIYYYW